MWHLQSGLCGATATTTKHRKDARLNFLHATRQQEAVAEQHSRDSARRYRGETVGERPRKSMIRTIDKTSSRERREQKWVAKETLE